jgi:hypothetical protein
LSWLPKCPECAPTLRRNVRPRYAGMRAHVNSESLPKCLRNMHLTACRAGSSAPGCQAWSGRGVEGELRRESPEGEHVPDLAGTLAQAKGTGAEGPLCQCRVRQRPLEM